MNCDNILLVMQFPSQKVHCGGFRNLTQVYCEEENTESDSSPRRKLKIRTLAGIEPGPLPWISKIEI